MTTTNIKPPRRISFSQHHADGVLTVYQEGQDGVPFRIRRVFTITGVSVNGGRGNHAHRCCSQILSCIAGSCYVRFNDGFEEAVEPLYADGTALLVPPMLWNTVIFKGPSTVLTVFCDEFHAEADYVRDWDEYMRLRRGLLEP